MRSLGYHPAHPPCLEPPVPQKIAKPPKKPLRLWACAVVLGCCGQAATAQPVLPIFDAHLHYSHDAWERLPPKDAVALLRQAGLKRAMVSSSSDEGTQ
jgi:hypothetical protein